MKSEDYGHDYESAVIDWYTHYQTPSPINSVNYLCFYCFSKSQKGFTRLIWITKAAKLSAG